MKTLCAAAALIGVFACPPLAAAQADPTTASKLSCVPDSVTRCTAAGECTTRAATPGQKAEPLIIDFAARTIGSRRGGEIRQEGEVIGDTIVDGVRHITMSVAGGGPKVEMTLTRTGKLSIAVGETGDKAEATCTPES